MTKGTPTALNDIPLHDRPIGVFDSGVGGLTVLREIQELLPNEQCIYLGDTARVPYGNKSTETIRRFARQSASFLMRNNVKLIVVACNTVSALALDAVRDVATVPVVEMILPATELALQSTRNCHIGVIGTHSTINSDAYQSSLRKRNPTMQISAVACPLFVPLAEEGWFEHRVSQLVAGEYLKPLRDVRIDTLILGCTHYPMLLPVIQEYLPSVQLVNTGLAAAEVVREILEKNQLRTHNSKKSHYFYVTDKPELFRPVAERFLQIPILNTHQISLETLYEYSGNARTN